MKTDLFPNSVSNSVRFVSVFAAFVLLLPFARANQELAWNNSGASGLWTGTDANWWSASGTATANFADGDAVVFGSRTGQAESTVTISSSTGVTIGASGTNPGMIIDGTGNWNFDLTYLTYVTTTTSGTTVTVTGTSHAGIGISGSGAGVLMQGTGTLTFSTTTGYTGATQVAAGTLRLGVANAIAQSSSVSLLPSAKLDLGGFNQSLNALNLAASSTVMFSSTGANYSTLTLGALGGTGGVFRLRTDTAAAQSDKIVISGSSEGSHTLEFDRFGSAAPKPDTLILVVETPKSGGAIFSGTLDNGIDLFSVEQGVNGSWYLSNSPLMSRVAAALVASAAAAGQDWHYELDALYKRMGELRESPVGGHGNLWARVNATRLNVDADLTGYNFHQYSYGVTAGADKALHTGNSTWYLGGFGGVSRVDRDFDAGDGVTDTAGGGLYLTWVYATGWYADVIARVDRNKNEITASTVDGYVTNARYNSNVKGFSVEFGRRLLVNEEWWIEPGVQYATADLDGASYEATSAAQPPIAVQVDKSRASQGRVLLRFGEAGGENPGWHPYAKVAAVYSTTSGGRVRAGERDFRADFDGWRWEIGFGAAYVINARSQVYYDYEYAHATDYSRPWSFNLGYRLAW